ncbi:MAG: hypothetical protein ABS82_17935 [Rhodanobacter sp. SCN 67-45]|nr:MAG: hypothetical protein ABS82_17935 [Rhodanobacter sp. SCN 67-45]
MRNDRIMRALFPQPARKLLIERGDSWGNLSSAEYVGQHVLDDRDGICFANVASLRSGQDGLIAFKANDKTLRDFLR